MAAKSSTTKSVSAAGKNVISSNSQWLYLDDEIEATLLAARRLYFSDAVTGESTTAIIRKLWYLDIKSPGEPITFVITSPGGSVDAGFAIWDQIKMIESPITTLVTGMAASMGSVLSLCAAPGRRFSTPNARFMLHQPSTHGDMRGPATDLEIQAREIIKTRARLVDLYAEATGKPHDQIERTLDRDTWMSPQEALAYGLLDGIVERFSEL